MIRVGNYTEIDSDKYDENWLIVQEPDPYPDFVKLKSMLGPSPNLFHKYRCVFHAGLFDREFFDQVYVPQFLRELSENEEALAVLENLVNEGAKKDIFLACYCEEETLCHRSIIAGILLGMGADIETVQEYRKYYEMFRRYPCRAADQ